MITLPIPSLEGLVTERLLFRRLRNDDLAWWMGYINSAEAIRFMPFQLGNRRDGEYMIQRSLERYGEDGSGLHAVLLRESDLPVGQCGLLTQVVDEMPELEIGYHFLPQHWGHGYATEAARACKAFASKNHLAPSVISLIDPANHRSQAVATRNGMERGRLTIHRDKEAYVYRTPLAKAV